eukprot:1222139-Prymnesium_polylepis.1
MVPKHVRTPPADGSRGSGFQMQCDCHGTHPQNQPAQKDSSLLVGVNYKVASTSSPTLVVRCKMIIMKDAPLCRPRSPLSSRMLLLRYVALSLPVIAARHRMLVSDLSIVRNAHIVLASAACAGRVRIVNDQLGLKARVVHPAAEFAPSPSTAPNDFFVCERARAQAMDVFWRAGAPFHAKHGQVPSLVVGVDTVVRLGDE